MPREDGLFFSDMKTADDDFQTATRDSVPALFLKDHVDQLLQRFEYYYHFFHDLGRISGGTAPVIDQIKLRILPRLKKYELSNNEGPIEVIRGKLEGWQGPEGSASYRFKWNYLPKLATSMENQYSAMQGMAAVMITHEGIIDQARQKYLDIINNTTAAIEESTEEHKQKSSIASTVVNVVGAIATGVGIGAEAGPVAGAVFGAVQGIGSIIDAATTSTSGDNWFDITTDGLDKLDALVTAIKEETSKVEAALDEVLVYVDGEQRDQFLAPSVGPTAPTTV